MSRLGQTLKDLKQRQTPSPARSDARLTEMSVVGSNPGRLGMKMFIPTTLQPEAGLVVVLHGCTQTAAGYAGPAGWLDLAERFGFAVLAPEQQRENNPNLCFNWFEPADVRRTGGEAESVAQMILQTIRAHDLDSARVFVTGLSAGGAMAGVMLATYPEVFQAGAIVAGLPYGVASSAVEAFGAMSMATPIAGRVLGDAVRGASGHAGPWPTVSVWHGQADTLVRPAAGDAVAAQWRDVHGASEASRTARTPDGRDFQVWLSAEGEPVVELHRIPGMGHGAPVRTRGADSYGSASLYTHEVGVSSVYEIALGWGLAIPNTRNATTAGAGPHQTPGGEPIPTPGGYVTTVINDALRSAGLMK